MGTLCTHEKGVTVSLRELIDLKWKSQGFTLLPRQPVRSLLAGKYGSKLRGRGLNFEEIRQYRAGDDIRTMDWKVTARTGKPHVRVYTEERDRPVVIIVDQRLSMFFGSRVSMKSVTAAQLGSLAIWKATGDGDRAGALVFNDTEIKQLRPHRSQKNVTAILKTLVHFNSALCRRSDAANNGSMMNRALRQIAGQATHDYLYLVISDFFGLDPETHRLIKQISFNNDLLLCLVHDPLAREMPEQTIINVTDGKRQMELDSSYTKLARQFPQILEGRVEQLTRELSGFGVPTLPINNADDISEQLQKLLGRLTGRRR